MRLLRQILARAAGLGGREPVHSSTFFFKRSLDIAPRKEKTPIVSRLPTISFPRNVVVLHFTCVPTVYFELIF